MTSNINLPVRLNTVRPNLKFVFHFGIRKSSISIITRAILFPSYYIHMFFTWFN